MKRQLLDRHRRVEAALFLAEQRRAQHHHPEGSTPVAVQVATGRRETSVEEEQEDIEEDIEVLFDGTPQRPTIVPPPLKMTTPQCTKSGQQGFRRVAIR